MKPILPEIVRICYAETKTLMRDKGILIFILFVPLMYPLLYSYVYTNEVVRDVPAVVIDESDTSLSHEFVRKVDASADVKIVGRVSDMAEAQEKLRRREAFGIIWVPREFTHNIWKGDQAVVGLYCDMSSMLYYKGLLLTCTNVSLEMNKDIKISHHQLASTTREQDDINRMPILYDYVALYNPQSGFASFLIPPVLMLIIQQTLLLGVGMAMGDTRERNHGRVVPAGAIYNRPVPIVIGKMLPYLMLYLLLGVYMFVAVNDMFGLPRLGDYWTFVAFLTLYLLACIFFSMAMSMLIYRREDCILLFVFMSVPLLFLSGVSWPTASMPSFWRLVGCLFPSTFGLNAYVSISTMGASIAQILPLFKGLLIQTVVYFTLAVLLYWRKIKKAPTPQLA